jgi:mono/diheme cytochrome c family protein
MCHGPWGEGDGPLAADLRKNSAVGPAQINNAARLAEIGRDGIVQVITQGGSGTHRSNLMPPFRNQVPPAVIQSIASWVLAMPTIKPGIPRSTVDKYLAAPPGVPGEGRKLFVYYCTMCHGPEGKGNGFMADTIAARYKVHPRDLTDSTYFADKGDQELFETISLGGRYTGHSAVMPGWELPLAPAQIKDLISYIRSISRTPAKP